MNELLYLNNILFDLKGKSITRKIQIGNIGDVSTRKSSYSYTLKLANTKNNIRALDMLGVMGNTSRKPYEVVSAIYLVEGLPLIENGYAHIKGAGLDFEVNIYDGVRDLSERLGNKKINELPLSDLEHILTSQLVADSFNNTDGFIYGLADFGYGLSNSVKAEALAPSIYVHTLFRKIFENSGLILEGDFFTINKTYLSEVMTASKGYSVSDSSFISTPKGGADTDILSDYKTSSSPIFVDRKFTLSNIGLIGASVVGGDIEFSTPGTYKINLDVDYNIYKTYLGIEVKINDVVKSVIWIDEGNSSISKDVTFTVDSGDVLSLHIKGSSEIGNVNIYEVNYTVSCDMLLYLQNGGNLVIPSDYLGDVTQVEFIKDVMRRYGLVIHPVPNSSNYLFKRMEVLLNDTDDAEDWTSKLGASIPKEKFVSGYSQINKARYQYPEAIVEPNNDGEMLINDKNTSLEADLFTSNFEIPIESGVLSGQEFYLIPLREVSGAEVKNLETPTKLMSVKRFDVSINIKLFDEVTGVTLSENIPFLSLDNISMQYFINTSYRAFNSLINNYKSIDFKMNLSVIDIYNLDFFRLKYLKQTGRFYYLNNVTNSPGKISSVNMIEISEFPSNQPPSQIGDFSFSMNHGLTRIITLDNLLTGYEDPENDGPLKIKIISGFDVRLEMRNNGALINSETEILVENLSLTVEDVSGVLDPYSIPYIFTIADTGSGGYSEEIGILTANVLELANTPPVADAGSDQIITLSSIAALAQLNGSASYDDTGEIISYVWSIESKPLGSNASINVQDTSTPNAVAVFPNEINSVGVYTMKLIVIDEFGVSDEDTSTINVIQEII
jgi:hypothetical protein